MGSFLNWAAGQLPRISSDAADVDRGRSGRRSGPMSASAPASPSRSASPPRASPRPRLALWELLTFAVRQRSWPHLPGSRWLQIAVESLTAVLFAYLWERFGPSWKLLAMTLIGSFFVLIAIIDLRYHLIPNVLTYPAAAATLLLQLVVPGQSLPIALLGGAMGLAPFLLVALLKPGDIGGGDVKLAAVIGLMVGFPLVLWALLLATVAGGITAVLLLLTRRWGPKSHMPYAPFLCLGAMCCLICPIPLPALAL
jgi:prepilin signal peptidase PulO-like enzyme (type II secretory pathway)